MALHGTLITEMRLAEALLLERDPLAGGAILAQAEPEELIARRVFELVVVAHLGPWLCRRWAPGPGPPWSWSVCSFPSFLSALMKPASSGGTSPTAMISLLAGGENVVVLQHSTRESSVRRRVRWTRLLGYSSGNHTSVADMDISHSRSFTLRSACDVRGVGECGRVFVGSGGRRRRPIPPQLAWPSGVQLWASVDM